ncbi:thioesterase family protein [Kordiimonas sp. SCSIO 12610]|uniref:thioesterase family protein n=1 Tax=Kordiimonas sp. SCSIO 12610 TaxID=2829597 RepID=UPI00210C44A8|nr:thioesterase family protein [Kordiimonas sp. SCSIO 12610]UTW55536.1 thioesterase family protein [Kordiimonas sp. SCSIO 12610]
MQSLQEIFDYIYENKAEKVLIPEGWSQGRAAYGGLVAAAASSSMISMLGDDAPPIRSFMGSFVAPASPGDCMLDARLVRQGKNVSQLASNVIANDKVCFQSMALFGANRDTKSVVPNFSFNPEPRDSVPPLVPNPMMPPFLSKFDCHWSGGGIPLSGSKDRRLGLWVRHRSDMSRYPVEKIISICDFPPPIMLSHYTKPVMVSSLSWSLEFLMPVQDIKSDWFYLDFNLDAAANGYSQQSGYVFTEDGQLCALSRQCMVYFE